MKLLHASQIGADVTCLHELLDWLYDADAAGISGWSHFAAQQRAYAVVAAFDWLHYRLGVIRMAQVVIAGLQTPRLQQRALFEIGEAA